MSEDDHRSAITGPDEAILLDLLFSHKLEWIRHLLKQKSLRRSGTAAELYAQIESHLETGALTKEDLVNLLDRIEGWGNQHCYLYTAPSHLIAELSDQAKFKDFLKRNRVSKLFNRRIPLLLPDQPKLSAVEWSQQGVRLVWVEKREYRDRLEDEDYTENDVEFHAYKLKLTRGITSFHCDLVTGDAELLIQRLPSGNDYPTEKQKYEEFLGDFFDVSQLAQRTIAAAINKLDSAPQIRKRASELATHRGHRITFTSRSRNDDVYADPDIRKSRNQLGALITGRLGNYYWPIDGNDIHIKLYAKDHRIGIFGECTPEVVRNVLSQVRSYC
jgi:hypothetical protein